jgi:hypothetical protein
VSAPGWCPNFVSYIGATRQTQAHHSGSHSGAVSTTRLRCIAPTSMITEYWGQLHLVLSMHEFEVRVDEPHLVAEWSSGGSRDGMRRCADHMTHLGHPIGRPQRLTRKRMHKTQPFDPFNNYVLTLIPQVNIRSTILSIIRSEHCPNETCSSTPSPGHTLGHELQKLVSSQDSFALPSQSC